MKLTLELIRQIEASPHHSKNDVLDVQMNSNSQSSLVYFTGM